MAYEPGTYLRELREAHQRGEHTLDECDDCPVCSFQVVPEGFASLAEYDEAVMDVAGDLQTYVDAHNRGEHRTPVDECIECTRAEG